MNRVNATRDRRRRLKRLTERKAGRLSGGNRLPKHRSLHRQLVIEIRAILLLHSHKDIPNLPMPPMRPRDANAIYGVLDLLAAHFERRTLREFARPLTWTVTEHWRDASAVSSGPPEPTVH